MPIPRDRTGGDSGPALPVSDADDHDEDVARPRPARRARTPQQRWMLFAGLAALALLIVGAAWIVVTGLIARSQLLAIRNELPRLRQAVVDGRVAEARSLAEGIRRDAQRAHAMTTGPAWWVASGIPVLGTPLHTTRVLAGAVDTVGNDALPAVVRLTDRLSSLQPHNSSIDLTAVSALGPDLDRAARAVHSVTTHAAGIGGSWFGPISSARSEVLRELTRVDGELSGASRAVRIAVPMLGGTTPQRYFIGFLNEAESRGVGGIPGAFAIATADHGRVSFDHFGSDSEMSGVRGNVNLGTDFAARYSQDDPTGVFQNSDISPDFRDAGQIWAAMWQAKTGQRIDGAIAVDPTALGYLLKVIGPATLDDGRQVSAKNVVALTQQTQYALFPGNSQRDKAERKDYLISIAKAVSARFTHGGGNARDLVKALSRSARERRLVVWSAKPSVESQLELADWAGALGNSFGTPLTGFTVTNAAASKLDYYLDRTMTYRRTDCAPGGTATATLTLTNRAPRSGLPPYVVIRADQPPPGAKPGDNKLLVTYYASADARIVGVTLDGKPVPVVVLPEGDALAATLSVELPAGRSRTLSVRIAEPAGYGGDLQVLDQPLPRPARITTKTCE